MASGSVCTHPDGRRDEPGRGRHRGRVGFDGFALDARCADDATGQKMPAQLALATGAGRLSSRRTVSVGWAPTLSQ